MDLIRSIPLPNMPYYRKNPKENDIEKVEELLSKWDIQANMSTYLVPTLLMPKIYLVELRTLFLM